MIKMCGIDFEKNRLRKEAFIDNLETVSGCVSEKFFDSLVLQLTWMPMGDRIH
jgi:hypothetical protein